MDITEKDLEDLIFDDIDKGGDNLLNRGLGTFLLNNNLPNKIYWYRQASLLSYGIADIIGVTRYRGAIYVDLIELKNRPLKSEDFDQLYRYKTAVQQILFNTFRGKVKAYIYPYLIGPGIDSGHYIQNNSDATIFTFTFGINGFDFKFHRSGWVRVDSKAINIKNVSYSQEIIIRPEIEKVYGE